TEVIQELLRFLRCDLKWLGKPQQQASIDEGVADNKHEHDRQQGQRHCADNHVGFEASAKLFAAALDPEPQCRAAKNQQEDQKRCGDKAGHRVEHHHFAPALWVEGHIEGAERKYDCEQQGKENSADPQALALFRFQSAHTLVCLTKSAVRKISYLSSTPLLLCPNV